MDHRIKLPLQTGTWHDADYVAMRRLRVDGFQIAHDHVFVMTSLLPTTAASRLSRLDVGIEPTSFEWL